jgi:hypothetical protein
MQTHRGFVAKEWPDDDADCDALGKPLEIQLDVLIGSRLRSKTVGFLPGFRGQLQRRDTAQLAHRTPVHIAW